MAKDAFLTDEDIENSNHFWDYLEEYGDVAYDAYRMKIRSCHKFSVHDAAKFIIEWNETVQRLMKSGANLSRIVLVGRDENNNDD